MARMRHIERALIEHYKALIASITTDLDKANYDQSVAILELPDMIRSYEDVKAVNIARYFERLRELYGKNDVPALVSKPLAGFVASRAA